MPVRAPTMAAMPGSALHARVRMQYRFGGRDIDAVIGVERRDGRWYVADFLRHAEGAAGTAIAAH